MTEVEKQTTPELSESEFLFSFYIFERILLYG